MSNHSLTVLLDLVTIRMQRAWGVPEEAELDGALGNLQNRLLSYGTDEQARAAITAIAAASSPVMGAALDIGDFPFAEELARRLGELS